MAWLFDDEEYLEYADRLRFRRRPDSGFSYWGRDYYDQENWMRWQDGGYGTSILGESNGIVARQRMEEYLEDDRVELTSAGGLAKPNPTFIEVRVFERNSRQLTDEFRAFIDRVIYPLDYDEGVLDEDHYEQLQQTKIQEALESMWQDVNRELPYKFDLEVDLAKRTKNQLEEHVLRLQEDQDTSDGSYWFDADLVLKRMVEWGMLAFIDGYYEMPTEEMLEAKRERDLMAESMKYQLPLFIR